MKRIERAMNALSSDISRRIVGYDVSRPQRVEQVTQGMTYDERTAWIEREAAFLETSLTILAIEKRYRRYNQKQRRKAAAATRRRRGY